MTLRMRLLAGRAGRHHPRPYQHPPTSQSLTETIGVSKFVALIEPDNDASRGVARATGFVEAGLDARGPRLMLRHEYPRDAR